MLQSTLVQEKSPNLLQSMSLLHVAVNFGARNVTKFIAKCEPVLRFLMVHVAVNFGARKVTKFIAKYEPVSRFLIDPVAVTCCSQLWC